VVADLRRPLEDDVGASIAHAQPEVMMGPQPQHPEDPLLGPRAADRERLARRAAGPPDDQAIRRYAPRDHLASRQRPEILSRRDGYGGQVGHAADVGGPEAVSIEEPPVVGHAVVGMRHQLAEPPVLERSHLVAAGARTTRQHPERRGEIEQRGVHRRHSSAERPGASGSAIGTAVIDTTGRHPSIHHPLPARHP
jgi:hypothetical protein